TIATHQEEDLLARIIAIALLLLLIGVPVLAQEDEDMTPPASEDAVDVPTDEAMPSDEAAPTDQAMPSDEVAPTDEAPAPAPVVAPTATAVPAPALPPISGVQDVQITLR